MPKMRRMRRYDGRRFGPFGVGAFGGGSPAPAAWTPESLPGLAPSIQVALSLSLGLLWQDAGKTVAATADGDPIRVPTCPFTGFDYVAPSDSARSLLWDEGSGKWSAFFDGTDDRFAMPAGTDWCTAWGLAWLNSSAVPPSSARIPVSPLGGLELGLVTISGYTSVSLMMGGVGTSVGFDEPAALAADAWNVLVVAYLGGGVSAPANYRAWFNGVEKTVVASGEFNGGAVGTIGSRDGAQFLDGRIAGFVPSSNSAATAAAAADLSNYLRSLCPA
jgi:hypothetical protein